MKHCILNEALFYLPALCIYESKSQKPLNSTSLPAKNIYYNTGFDARKLLKFYAIEGLENGGRKLFSQVQDVKWPHKEKLIRIL